MKKMLLSLLCLGMCLSLLGCSSVEEKKEQESNVNTNISNDLSLSNEDIKKLLRDNGYSLEGDDDYDYYDENRYEIHNSNKNTKIIFTKDSEYGNEIRFISPEKSESLHEISNGVYPVSDKESYKGYLSWLDEIGLSNKQIVDFFNECLKEKQRKKEKEENKKENTNTKVSIMSKFISNGYEEYDGNYRKDVEVNGSIMHKYFYLTDDTHYFSISDDLGNETTYFFTENYAGQNKCKFDLSSNKAKKGSTCSSSEKENARYIKELFEKEIKELGITINDLN